MVSLLQRFHISEVCNREVPLYTFCLERVDNLSTEDKLAGPNVSFIRGSTVYISTGMYVPTVRRYVGRRCIINSNTNYSTCQCTG